MKIVTVILIACGITCFASNEPNLPSEITDAKNSDLPKSEPNLIALAQIDTESIIQLHPAQNVNRPNYHLLPLKCELVDTASLPIYLEVFKKDPNNPQANPNFSFIDQQLKKPGSQMDVKAVGGELERCLPKLELLQKASLCRHIQWPWLESYYYYRQSEDDMMQSPEWLSGNFSSSPHVSPDDVVLTSSEYLDFLNDILQYGKLIAIKTRYHISKRQYADAAEWLKVGLAISRQMTMHSDLHLSLAANANGAVMLRQIELWVQMPGSPSLYRSLQDLPRPLLKTFDLKSLVREEPERVSMGREMMGFMPDELEQKDNEFEDSTNHLTNYTNEQFDLMSRRTDRFIAVLECLEGLRYYAALNEGKLPDTLADITEIRLPADPLTNTDFSFSKENNTYVLCTSDAYNDQTSTGFHYTIQMTPLSGN